MDREELTVSREYVRKSVLVPLFVDESLIYSHALQRKEESGALCR